MELSSTTQWNIQILLNRICEAETFPTFDQWSSRSQRYWTEIAIVLEYHGIPQADIDHLQANLPHSSCADLQSIVSELRTTAPNPLPST